jgi:hypothetical protein
MARGHGAAALGQNAGRIGVRSFLRCNLWLLAALLTAAKCTDAAVDRFDAAIATVRRGDAAP